MTETNINQGKRKKWIGNDNRVRGRTRNLGAEKRDGVCHGVMGDKIIKKKHRKVKKTVTKLRVRNSPKRTCAGCVGGHSKKTSKRKALERFGSRTTDKRTIIAQV